MFIVTPFVLDECPGTALLSAPDDNNTPPERKNQADGKGKIPQNKLKQVRV